MTPGSHLRRRLAVPATALAVLAAAATALAACGGGSGGTSTAPTPSLGHGGQLFVEKCGSCHTLAAAGTDGRVGPNLDTLRPSKENVLTAIHNGPGVMPSGLVQGADAQAVAKFVSENAGKK
jgi:mono/diheme cytochrome c family protein